MVNSKPVIFHQVPYLIGNKEEVQIKWLFKPFPRARNSFGLGITLPIKNSCVENFASGQLVSMICKEDREGVKI